MKLIIYMLAGVGIAALIGKFVSRKKNAEKQRRDAQAEVLGAANITNDITQVKKDGVVRLPPFGDSKVPIETYVTKRHRYDEGPGSASWYELVCQHGRRELLLEWSREGGQLYVTGGFEEDNPKFPQLGLTEAQLVDFDENEEGSFEFNGVTWHYEESGERLYYENEGREGEGYYAWEFTNEEESRYISIEKWPGDRTFTVYHLWSIDAEAIEVFEGGK
jgi:hypothetical protein